MAPKNGRPVHTGPIRVIIYRRISLDRTGEEAGTTRQDKDCKAYCAAKDWTVVANLVDNDISASKYARKKRPGYKEAIRMVENGEADAIVAYHLNRLWRQSKELEYLVDLVELRHIIVATLNGDINLQTAEGRLHARIMVAVAANESDNLSRRVKRKKLESAQDGLPASCVNAFGWNHTERDPNGNTIGNRAGTVQVQAEADAIKDAAKRFLGGESIASIARLWTEQGFDCPQGGKTWDGTKVRLILGNPRNAGLLSHNGAILGKGQWEPIIDEVTWRRITGKLNDPAKRQGPKKATLLTSLVHCARCGATMYRQPTSNGRSQWACKRKLGSDACGRMAIVAERVETMVTEAVLAVFDGTSLKVHRPPQSAEDEGNNALESEIATIEAALALRLEMLDASEITRAEYVTTTKRLRDSLDSLRRRQAVTSRTLALVPYQSRTGALRQAWPNLTLDQRRAVLAAAIDRVVIAPATTNTFDPKRVSIAWRG